MYLVFFGKRVSLLPCILPITLSSVRWWWCLHGRRFEWLAECNGRSSLGRRPSCGDVIDQWPLVSRVGVVQSLKPGCCRFSSLGCRRSQLQFLVWRRRKGHLSLRCQPPLSGRGCWLIWPRSSSEILADKDLRVSDRLFQIPVFKSLVETRDSREKSHRDSRLFDTYKFTYIYQISTHGKYYLVW